MLKSGIGQLLLQKRVRIVSKCVQANSTAFTHVKLSNVLTELRMKWDKPTTGPQSQWHTYWQVPSSCDWHPGQLVSLELWTSLDLTSNVNFENSGKRTWWSNTRNDRDPLQPSALKTLQTCLHNEMHQNMRRLRLFHLFPWVRRCPQ